MNLKLNSTPKAPSSSRLLLFALGGVMGSAACSAPAPDLATENSASTEEAFNQASCPSAPDATFNGEINPLNGPAALPSLGSVFSQINYNSNVGFLTPDTYSNPRCSKSEVVQIKGWLHRNADFVVTARNIPSPAGAVSQADCEALYLAATIYGPLVQPGALAATTVQQTTRVDGGHFSTSVDKQGITHTWCTPPKVIFGGRTWRPDDWESFSPGETYTIAATYRTTVGSTITTMPMSLYTASTTCGKDGQSCCTANANYTPDDIAEPDHSRWTAWCEAGARCDGGRCDACGQIGHEACPAASGEAIICRDENSTLKDGSCVHCGNDGEPCCHNFIYPVTRACANTTLTCMGGDQSAPASSPASTPGTCSSVGAPPGQKTNPTTGPTKKPPTITGTMCNGRSATDMSTAHFLYVQSADGCGDYRAWIADTDAEAQACAAAAGWTVLTGPQTIASYPFCVCSYGGASTIAEWAYSDQAATSCAHAHDINADTIDMGACPDNKACP